MTIEELESLSNRLTLADELCRDIKQFGKEIAERQDALDKLNDPKQLDEKYLFDCAPLRIKLWITKEELNEMFQFGIKRLRSKQKKAEKELAGL